MAGSGDVRRHWSQRRPQPRQGCLSAAVARSASRPAQAGWWISRWEKSHPRFGSGSWSPAASRKATGINPSRGWRTHPPPPPPPERCVLPEPPCPLGSSPVLCGKSSCRNPDGAEAAKGLYAGNGPCILMAPWGSRSKAQMPTSFSSCKAAPEIARGGKKRQKKKRKREEAHAHAPLHLALLPSARNLIGIFKGSRLAAWKRHLPPQPKAGSSRRLRWCLGCCPPPLGHRGCRGTSRPCALPGARDPLAAGCAGAWEHRRRQAAVCIAPLLPASPAPPCCSGRCRVWLLTLFASHPGFLPHRQRQEGGHGASFPRLDRGTALLPATLVPASMAARGPLLPGAFPGRLWGAQPPPCSALPPASAKGAGGGGHRSPGRRGKPPALAPSRARSCRAGGERLPAPRLSAGETVVHRLLFSPQPSEHVEHPISPVRPPQRPRAGKREQRSRSASGARPRPRQPSYPGNYKMLCFPGITIGAASLPLNKYGCTAAAEKNQQK